MDEYRRTSRRSLLKTGALLAGSTLFAALAPGKPAFAQQKASKAAMQYQDKPKGDQQCSNCMHFVPKNSCAIVDGNISPQGWCIAWVKKT